VAPAARGKKHSNCKTKPTRHVWINSQIVAKSSATVDDLLTVISKHLPQMNLVNMATALHRLSKLGAHDSKVQSQVMTSRVFASLVDAVAIGLADCNPDDVQPQSISNIMWALTSIGYYNADIVHHACTLALPKIPYFKSFELAMLLWALAKPTTACDATKLGMGQIFRIFDVAAEVVLHHIPSMEYRGLSMIVWSHATIKHGNDILFRHIAAQMLAKIHTATCQEMGSTAWAFGTFHYAFPKLFEALCEKAILEMQYLKSQELSNMLWGFASSGYFHEAFFRKAACVANSKDLSTQHLANIIWAFSLVCPLRSMTQAIILNCLPSCTQEIHMFKSQELSSVVISVAKAFSFELPGESPMLPDEVEEFFCIVPSALPLDLASVSTRSLLNVASALTALPILATRNALFPRLVPSVLKRANTMPPTELVRFLHVFLVANRQGANLGLPSLLGMFLALRMENLKARDQKLLSRTLVEHYGLNLSRDLSLKELRECCIQLAQEECGTSCSLEKDISSSHPGCAHLVQRFDFSEPDNPSFDSTSLPHLSMHAGQESLESSSSSSEFFDSGRDTLQKLHSLPKGPMPEVIKRSFFEREDAPAAEKSPNVVPQPVSYPYPHGSRAGWAQPCSLEHAAFFAQEEAPAEEKSPHASQPVTYPHGSRATWAQPCSLEPRRSTSSFSDPPQPRRSTSSFSVAPRRGHSTSSFSDPPLEPLDEFASPHRSCAAWAQLVSSEHRHSPSNFSDPPHRGRSTSSFTGPLLEPLDELASHSPAIPRISVDFSRKRLESTSSTSTRTSCVSPASLNSESQFYTWDHLQDTSSAPMARGHAQRQARPKLLPRSQEARPQVGGNSPTSQSASSWERPHIHQPSCPSFQSMEPASFQSMEPTSFHSQDPTSFITTDSEGDYLNPSCDTDLCGYVTDDDF